MSIPVPPDPQLLARIAAAAKGQTFTAQDQTQLQDIYKHLGARLGSRPRPESIRTEFVVATALLLLLAAGLSLRWTAELP
jgi:hypothetical protein